MKAIFVSLLVALSPVSVNLPSGGTARISYEEKEPEVYYWVLVDSSNQRRSGVVYCGTGSVDEQIGDKLVFLGTHGDAFVINEQSPCLDYKFNTNK